MDYILKAQYTRETKLNYKFHRAAIVAETDWTVMNCYYVDYSSDRAHAAEYGYRIMDGNGNDITAQETRDYFVIEMISEKKRRFYGAGGECPQLGTSHFRFYTAEEANAWVKQMLHDKYLNGWKRVK